MTKPSLSFACTPYDRILPMACGMVAPEGIDINYLPLNAIEIFWRQLRHEEFDIAESSLSSYAMLRSLGDERFIAIPVFVSRFFRHSSIFVNVRKGITSPQDLKGKIVGVPEYQMTAAVWERGIIEDEYEVPPREMVWRTGGQETPGRVEKVKVDLPPDIQLEPIGPGKTLSQMLEEGEIDAFFTARPPLTFTKGSSNIRRLFQNYMEVEEQYYRRTGIFPIMHTIVIKREIYERNPWIAMNLYKAFRQAKSLITNAYSLTSVPHVTLPWVSEHAERVRAIMGEDWWPYGLDANRTTLETFLRYHHAQGLSSRLLTPDELFAPETLDEFKV